MSEHVKELFFYFINVALDSSAKKGWKGSLYLWPVFSAVLIAIFLVVRVFI